MLKKLIPAIILLCAVVAAYAQTVNVRAPTQKDFAQQSNMNPTPGVGYKIDCLGYTYPNGLPATIVTAASGAGTSITITESSQAASWVTVGFVNGGTTTFTCAEPQQAQ